MNKIETLKETLSILKNYLQDTEKMWEDRKDPAYIAGYLTGTVKTAIMEIESILEVNKK
jgi:hypothetical protein